MTSLERTKRERFLPYAFARFGLETSVKAVAVDGRLRGDVVNEERHLIDLSTESWSQLEISLSVAVTDEAVMLVVPPEEHAAPPLTVLATIRCDATRVRQGVRVPLKRPSTSITVALERHSVHDSVELNVHLTRARASTFGRGFAARQHARVAGTRPWELRVDRSRTAAGAYIDVRFEHFSKWPSAWHKRAYRLDARRDAPILWLNSDHAELARVLEQKGTTGLAVRIRDVAYDAISMPVWLELAQLAILSRRDADESGYAWQDAVLKKFLPWLYPGSGDHDERVVLLQRELGDGGELDLIGRLFEVVQDEVEPARYLTQLIRESAR